MKKVVLLMLSLLIFGVIVAGCSSQTIISNETTVSEFTGTVYSESNKALEEVHVTLGSVAATDTRSDGTFTFTKQSDGISPITPGTYTVTFTKTGYESQDIPCDLKVGKCVLKNTVKMKPL